MPIHGSLARETIDDILSRRRAGEAIKAIAIDLDLSESTVGDYVAHLPRDRAPDEVRRLAIVACLDAGLDVRATALKVPCTVTQVVRIVTAARAAEPPHVATEEELEAARVERETDEARLKRNAYQRARIARVRAALTDEERERMRVRNLVYQRAYRARCKAART